MNDVNPRSFGQTHKVDATMLEEAPIFDGEDRIDHHFGNVVIVHQLPLGPLLGVEQRGHNLRFQFVCGQGAATSADALHFAIGNPDGRWLGCCGTSWARV